ALLESTPSMERISEIMKAIAKIQLRNAVTVLAVWAGIWGLLSGLLPQGWWHLPINLIGFLVSLTGAVSIRGSLQTIGNPGWLAFGIALVIWFVLVVILRSLILELLS
ncbi:MAG: hypothetical protein O2884_04795, partial [Chloroflexi bacterium]|nr:hypothetical protein [Chloroflexota bacterium]